MSRKTWQRIFSVLLIAGMLIGFAQPFQAAASVPEAESQLGALQEGDALDKVEGLVLEEIQTAGAADFFVWMTEKADLNPASDLETKEEKGQFVFETLVDTAERSQADLRGFLDKQGVDYKPFYIANKIFVSGGNSQLVADIATHPDVAQITANHAIQLEEPFKAEVPESPALIEPNITFVNADDVWAMGVTGNGVVLAGNDTGLDWDHPALINQYRGWDGSNADHNYNWWDATSTYPMVPGDGHGHGTHTTGTMVGDDGGTNQIGMAPGAQTVHCKNMTDGGSGDDNTFTTCFQWDLAPWDLSGANPMPSLAPDAINNSWGYFGGNAPQFEDEIAALQAAGIAVEVSAGNEGSSCFTLRSPGDYDQVITTGSVNHAGGTLPGTLTGFSSRGPSALYPGETDMPDIMAPGENIRSSVPGGGYEGGWSGTSMAGPHTVGLIGLMWSANPGLKGNVDITYQLINDTAVPLTGQPGSNCGGDYTDGPNNDWGYGTIESLGAVQAAMQFGGTGTLEGNVTDSVTSDPLQYVDIAASLSPTMTWTTQTDALGDYSLIVFSGTYTVTALLFGYIPEMITGVEVVSGTVTTRDFALDPAPSALVYGYVTDANTGWPLYASIDIAGYPGGGIWTDPVTGYYEVSLPEGSSYDFHVEAFVEGYLAEDESVGPVMGDMQQDFQMDVDAATCTAPGYGYSGGVFENFEGTFPPAGWQVFDNIGTGGMWNRNDFFSVVNRTAYGSGYSAAAEAYLSGIAWDTELWSPSINMATASPILTYASNFQDYVGNGDIWLDVSNDGGTTWTNLRYQSVDDPSGGTFETEDLTAYQNDTIILRWRYAANSTTSWYWHIDSVSIPGPCDPTAGGLVVGNVYDANAGLPMVGATVSNDSGRVTTAVETPDDPNVDDAFFSIFSPNGSHVFTATVEGFSPDVDTIDVPLNGTLGHDFEVTAGYLETDPNSMSVAVDMGSSTTLPLTLSNTGSAPVNFEFQEKDNGFLPTLTGAGTGLDGFFNSIAGSGGPDLFGYTYLDSDEPQGPEYQWVEISGTGTPVYLSDDNHDGPFPIGFTFNYYGTDLTEFYVQSNGTVNFVDSYVTLGNQCPIPNTSTPNGMIGLMWDDLDPGDTSDPVYYQYFDSCPYGGGACTVIQYENYHHYPGGGTIAGTWELILFDNSSFLIQYEDAGAEEGLGSTTGTENSDGTDGLGYESCNVQGTLHDNLAICYAYPGETPDCSAGEVLWLSEDPITGTVNVGADFLVDITFDASVVGQPGDYLADLRIRNDTPYGTVIVPVTMTVAPPLTYGKLEGTVMGEGYCDSNPMPLVEAEVYIESSTGLTVTLLTDSNGYYSYWLDEAGNPYEVTVTYPEHETGYDPNVIIVGQGTTPVDFNLRWLKPCVGVTPDNLHVTLDMGDNTTLPLTLTNTGAVQLTFELVEQNGGFDPAMLGALAPQIDPSPVSSVPPEIMRLPDGSVDCAAYENYPLAEPKEVAEQCSANVPIPAAGSGVLAPTDIAYAQDIGYISDNFVTFTLDDFPGQTVVGTSTNAYYGMDFDESASTLYALNDTTDQLGYIDLATGAFVPLVPCLAPVDVWTGLSIDPNTGVFYASDATSLYTIDPATGAHTLVGPFGTTLMIEIAVGPDGNMYGHDIGTDSIYSIDKNTGAATLIGLTGFAANYAQGMDFDNDDGTLYIFLYIGSGANVFGTVDLTTGTVTPLATNNPTGEFEGAIQIPGGGTDIPWLSEDPITGTLPADTGLLVADVTFDAGVPAITQPGDYYGTLKVQSDDPVNDNVSVPVTMTVLPTADLGKLEGTVTGLGYCDADPAPLEEAEVTVTGSGGGMWPLLTDESGYYSIWIDAPQQSPVTVTVTYPEHESGMASDVVISAGMTTTVDFDLRWLVPCVSVEPDAFEVTVALGFSTTEMLELTNDGALSTAFELEEQNIGFNPGRRSISIPPFTGVLPPDDTPVSFEMAPSSIDGFVDPSPTGNVINGSAAYGVNLLDDSLYTWPDIDFPGTWSAVGATGIGSAYNADFAYGDFSKLYVINNDNHSLYTVDTATGASTLIGPSSAPGKTWTGMAWDPTQGIMYGVATDGITANLYIIDLSTGALTLVGVVSGAPYTIAIAIDPYTGQMYGHDINSDNLITIDKYSGVTAVIGPTGFNANYAQGMDFEDESGILYLAAYDAVAFGQLRIADTSTGATTLVGAFPGGAEVDSFAFPTGGGGAGGDIPWLFPDPVTGTIDADSTSPVDLLFDSSVLTETGDYSGTLKVMTDDPVNDTVEIPLLLHVIPLEYGVALGGVYDLSGIPGEVVVYTLVVTNTSNGPEDTFTVTLGTSIFPAVPSVTEVGPLAAGESATFEVAVTIPEDALPGESDAVEVTLTSQEDESDPPASANATLITSVSGSYGVMMTADQTSGSGLPGATVAYTIRVTNTGTLQDTIVLTYFDVAPGWTVHLVEDTFDLAGGESAETIMHVYIPADAEAGDWDVFTLQAKSLHDPSKWNEVEFTTTVTELPVPMIFLPFINKP